MMYDVWNGVLYRLSIVSNSYVYLYKIQKSFKSKIHQLNSFIHCLVIWHFTYSFSGKFISASEYLAWIPNQTQLFTNYDTLLLRAIFHLPLWQRERLFLSTKSTFKMAMLSLSNVKTQSTVWVCVLCLHVKVKLRDLSRSPVMLSCQERCSSDQYQVVLLHYRYCPPFHA